MAQEPQPVRAAIYARISVDRSGEKLGVDRQIADCRQLAEVRGWLVVDTFTDNDVSAYSGRLRPSYRALLRNVAAGRYDVVLSWHMDRLHRSPTELEEWIETCERSKTDTITVKAGDLNLSTASGRAVARTLGAWARHESEQKGERIRRARQQAAESGKAHGPLGFGYNLDRTVNRAQAALIKEMARRILAGDSLYSIASDLNARGVPTPGGAVGSWRSVTIRQTIMRATLAGWREWRPAADQQRGGRGLGQFVARGDWKPILSRETVERVRLVLSSGDRKTSGRKPETLLTGILKCWRCGAPLSSAPTGSASGRKYACVAQPGLKRCGGTSVVGPPVDELVTAAVLEVLEGSRIPRVQEGRAGKAEAATKELLEARRTRDELAAERARGEVSPSEWAAMRRVLSDRIEKAERAVAEFGSDVAALSGVPVGAGAVSWWKSAELEQQRSVVKALIESVTIGPAETGGPRFDPSRVREPRWRV